MFDAHEIFGKHFHEHLADETDEYVESDAEQEADDEGLLSREDINNANH